MGYLTPLQRRGLALSGVAFSFCAFIIAQSSRFVKNFFLKSQFYFLGFRLHLLLSRSAPLRNGWWKNWETPHGIGLFRRDPLELLLCLYCITSWVICQEVFQSFWNFFFDLSSGRPLTVCHHYSTSAELCQVLFSINLKKFFGKSFHHPAICFPLTPWCLLISGGV